MAVKMGKRSQALVSVPSPASKAETEQLGTALNQIPYEGLEAVGRIFSEGAKKYSRDNWKKGVGDKGYQEERCSHAIRHLMLWANGDRSENHLAKVAWFCLTQIWTQTQEKPNDEQRIQGAL